MALGGHHIPDDVVERRYAAARRNFLELYQPMANSWLVCDNSDAALRPIAHGKRGQPPVVLEAAAYELIRGRTPDE